MLVCPLRAISPQPCFKHLQVNPLLTRKCLFTVLVTFSRRACHFVRKQKRQTHPRSKCRQIYSAMRQLCEGPKMLQLRRPLVGRTSYCMPVPLEDARSFLGFSVKATQRICLRYMLLKNNSNKNVNLSAIDLYGFQDTENNSRCGSAWKPSSEMGSFCTK